MENDSSHPSPVKESVLHAEEAEVMPLDDQAAILEQEEHTADLVAELSSAAVEMHATASHTTSRRASVLEENSAESRAAEQMEGEVTTAVPVAAHAVNVQIETETREEAAAAAREVEERASPDAGSASASPVGLEEDVTGNTEDGRRQSSSSAPPSSTPAVPLTNVTIESTPALPSPVQNNSAGPAGSISQTSPGLQAFVGDEGVAHVPAQAMAHASVEKSVRHASDETPHAEPPSSSMQAAVERSVGVYANARHNTTAYKFDDEAGSFAAGTGYEYGSAIPGARAGSRAGSYVQTMSGVGVLTDFQRGADNSHTNRMVDGSYSRYLEATRHVPEPEVYPSFYGAQPLAGTASASLLATQPSMEEARMSQRFQVTHPGMDPRATLDGGLAGSKGRRAGGLDESWSARSRGLPHDGLYRSLPHSQSRTAEELAEWGVTDNRDFPSINRKQRTLGGLASASVLRRELDLLEPEMNQELAEQRSLRRRAPQHCKPVRQERDFVYYNHHSKGFFVPHDLPPDTIMLNYNHTFDFGTGTRFLSGERPARRNPGAQGPLLYSEMTRGSRGWQDKTHPSLYGSTVRSSRARTAPDGRDGSSGGGTGSRTEGTIRTSSKHKTREQIATQSHSLRTAHAINKDDLHTSQFRRTRTIEDVMAGSPAYMPPTTVGGIQNALSAGAVSPQDIPSRLRTAVEVAATQYGLSDSASVPPIQNNKTSSSSNGGGSRVPSRSHAHGGVAPPRHSGRLYTTQDRPSPVSSARTATPGTRFTDKTSQGLLGVMGSAATSGASARAAPRAMTGAPADLSTSAARQQQQLSQPSQDSGLPSVTVSSSSHTGYCVSRLDK